VSFLSPPEAKYSREAIVSKNKKVANNDTGIWLPNQLTRQKRVLPLPMFCLEGRQTPSKTAEILNR